MAEHGNELGRQVGPSEVSFGLQVSSVNRQLALYRGALERAVCPRWCLGGARCQIPEEADEQDHRLRPSAEDRGVLHSG